MKKSLIHALALSAALALPPLAQGQTVGGSPTEKTEQEQASVASPALPLGFKVKRFIWTFIGSTVSSITEKESLKRPETQEIKMIKASELWPTVKIDHINVPDRVNNEDRSAKKQRAFKFIRKLTPMVSMYQQSYPQLPEDHDKILEITFPAKLKHILPAPMVPAEVANNPGDLVGALALQGPFAGYITKVSTDPSDNHYKIDLQGLEAYKVHPYLAQVGGVADLSYDASLGRMKVDAITLEGQKFSPEAMDKKGWDRVQKRMLAGLSAHSTLIRHLTNTHMLVAGNFAGVTHGQLSGNHPLRVLIHPHLHQTISTNNYQIESLIGSKYGSVPGIYSFDVKNVHKIMDDHAKNFHLSSMDIKGDAVARKMLDPKSMQSPVPYPYLSNGIKLWDIIANYVQKYINHYYPTEEKLAQDAEVARWYHALDKAITNGVTEYAPSITRENIAKLITLHIFTASVEHENIGNITWNYNNLQESIPSQVPLEGGCIPHVGVGFMKNVVGLATMNPLLTRLNEDFSFLALDQDGARIMKEFRDALAELQGEMDLEDQGKDKNQTLHRLYPKNLESSVST